MMTWPGLVGHEWLSDMYVYKIVALHQGDHTLFCMHDISHQMSKNHIFKNQWAPTASTLHVYMKENMMNDSCTKIHTSNNSLFFFSF